MEQKQPKHKNPCDTTELWIIPRSEKRRSYWLHIRVNSIELAKIESRVPEKESRSEYVRKKVLGEQDG
jgi:hypothetical protein